MILKTVKEYFEETCKAIRALPVRDEDSWLKADKLIVKYCRNVGLPEPEEGHCYDLLGITLMDYKETVAAIDVLLNNAVALGYLKDLVLMAEQLADECKRLQEKGLI